MEYSRAIIFILDSQDRKRFQEAKEELEKLRNCEQWIKTPFLFLANKQDLPNAASPSELTEKLDLRSIRGHEWYIQACCAITGEGLVDGLSWLAPKVKENKKKRA